MQRIPSCTAQLSNGSFCDASTMEGAPFPICERHAQQVHYFMDNDWSGRMNELREALHVRAPERAAAHEAHASALRAQSVVYYVRIGERVKIGYSTNLTQRLLALRVPRNAVLATEPGGQKLESIRHRQFSECRHGRWEEFDPTDTLMEHITAVRKRYGEPVITGSVGLAWTGA